MARIGDYVNPAFGAVSYDNLMAQQSNAAQRRDQNVSNAIGAVGDAVQLKKDYKDAVKVGTEKLDAISKLFGDGTGAWEQLKTSINDEEAPLSARAKMASPISDIANMQVEAIEQGRADRGMDQTDTRIGYEGDRVDIAQAAGESMNTYREAQTESTLMQNDEYLRQVGRQNMLAPYKTAAVLQDLDRRGNAGDEFAAQGAAAIQDAMKTFPDDPTVASEVAAMELERYSSANAKELMDGSYTLNGRTYSGKMVFDPATGTMSPVPVALDAETIDLASQMGGAGGANPVLLPGKMEGDTDLEIAHKKQALALGEQKLETGKMAIADAKRAEADAKQAVFDEATRTTGNIELLDSILSDPGLSAVIGMKNAFTNPGGFWKDLTGLGEGVPNPATDAANAYAKIQTFDARAFLEGIQQMKGMGSLSNAEGKKAGDALAVLSTNVSEEKYRENLNILRDQLVIGQKRMLSGERVNLDGSPVTTAPDPAAAATNRLKNFQGP